MSQKKQIFLQDSNNIKNIVIQVDLKGGATTVISAFSPWENLALIMEALGVVSQVCIEEGIDKKKVYQAIQDYIVKIIDDYKIIKKTSQV